MDLLMDGLLAAATLFAGGYCWVLARRVNDLKSLDKGLGASIVTLTRQIELARTTLEEARGAASENRQELTQLIGRAESAAARLRLLLTAAHEPEPAPLRREPLVATRPAHEPMPAPRAPAPVAAPPAPAPPQASAAPAPAPAPEPASAPVPVDAERAAEAPSAPEPLPRPAPEPGPAMPEPAPEPATRATGPEPAAELVLKPVPESAPVRPAAPNLVEVPKPRVLAPIESPLRRRTKVGDPAGSEDEIIEALSRLASGAR